MPPSSKVLQIENWAARQLADYKALRPGMIFAEGLVLDESQAYDLQAAVMKLRCEDGDNLIGYKVGCTSSTIRKQLGIEHSIFGRLYRSEQHASGAELSASCFDHLAIEGELAVELSRAPTEADFTAGRIPACVARVFPVIELHNQVLRGQRPTAGELIANNAIHAGVVAGTGLLSTEFDAQELAASQLSIFSNDALLGSCSGDSLVKTINTSLPWLANVLSARGERLDAGQIILTGSVPSLCPVSAGTRLRVVVAPLGEVEASCVN